MKKKTFLSLGNVQKKEALYEDGSEFIDRMIDTIQIVKILLDAKESKNPIAILCIGTPNTIADSLGPCVGTLLEDSNLSVKVLGTIREPLHALNLEEQLRKVEGYTIIAIDATIGRQIGSIACTREGIYPGAGVRKKLGYVGDYSITVTTATNPLFFYLTSEKALGFITMRARLIACCIKVIFGSI